MFVKNLLNIPFLVDDHNFIALANSSSDVVIIANMKKEILFANWVACQKTGYKERELLGKKLTMLYKKEDTARYIAKISKGLHESGRWNGEIEVRKKDGTTFGTEASIFEFYDKNGKPVEYKSTIDKRINGTYNGISVQDTWEEQERYLIDEKLGKYSGHYIARYERGKDRKSTRLNSSHRT